MVFTTEGLFEIAIESWSEWDLNPKPFEFRSDNLTELSGHEFNLHSEPTLYSYSNLIACSVSDFILTIAFLSRHVYLN